MTDNIFGSTSPVGNPGGAAFAENFAQSFIQGFQQEQQKKQAAEEQTFQAKLQMDMFKKQQAHQVELKKKEIAARQRVQELVGTQAQERQESGEKHAVAMQEDRQAEERMLMGQSALQEADAAFNEFSMYEAIAEQFSDVSPKKLYGKVKGEYGEKVAQGFAGRDLLRHKATSLATTAKELGVDTRGLPVHELPVGQRYDFESVVGKHMPQTTLAGKPDDVPEEFWSVLDDKQRKELSQLTQAQRRIIIQEYASQ